MTQALMRPMKAAPVMVEAGLETAWQNGVSCLLLGRGLMNIELIHRLRQEADRFLQDAYGLTLNIPLRVNRRLKRTLGRMVLKDGRPYVIELSAALLEYQDWDVIVDVLKHECIHYACFVLKRPYGDGDAHFRRELKRHGVSSSGTHHYKGMVHQYRCAGCDGVIASLKKYSLDRRGFVKKRRCGRCRGRVKYVGQGLNFADGHLS